MKHTYDPYILWKKAQGRIFFVNSTMPFEDYMDCFQTEKPFFLLSRLDDGRIAIIPNVLFIPWSYERTGYLPQDMLPTGYEYFTIKHGFYPVLVSAHPLPDFEDWYRKFERCVDGFVRQTIGQFVSSTYEFQPVSFAETVSRTKEPMTT